MARCPSWPLMLQGCALPQESLGAAMKSEQSKKNRQSPREFIVGPVVRTPTHPLQGTPGSIPGQGIKILERIYKQRKKRQSPRQGFPGLGSVPTPCSPTKYFRLRCKSLQNLSSYHIHILVPWLPSPQPHFCISPGPPCIYGTSLLKCLSPASLLQSMDTNCVVLKQHRCITL